MASGDMEGICPVPSSSAIFLHTLVNRNNVKIIKSNIYFICKSVCFGIVYQSTIFFRFLHPQNVHNLMGWVQEYEKMKRKVRFPFSCTISMYTKMRTFLTPPPSFISFISSNKQVMIQLSSNDAMIEHHKSK